MDGWSKKVFFDWLHTPFIFMSDEAVHFPPVHVPPPLSHPLFHIHPVSAQLSEVFSVCSFTCTCQHSRMSHPNWQQMVLFGYKSPDASAPPTRHAIYHHSPSLSAPLPSVPGPIEGTVDHRSLCHHLPLCRGMSARFSLELFILGVRGR